MCLIDKTMKKQDDNNKENEPVEREVESKDGDIENDELNLISDDDEKMETDDTGGGMVNSSETGEKIDGATKDADDANKMEEGECSSDDSVSQTSYFMEYLITQCALQKTSMGLVVILKFCLCI